MTAPNAPAHIKSWAIRAIACLLILASVLACAAPQAQLGYENDAALRALTEKETPPYPDARFVVFSDAHLYDVTLGTEGPAFEQYLAGDRKLLRESPQILEATLEALKGIPADFVLVAGDLTKDGEASSHRLVADYLRQLEASGKEVYVVPGNHDIRNGQAVRYMGESTEPVPNITPAEFVQIHGQFGYDQALHRDPASLSYVAEPKAGLWLLALDACRYRENKEGHEAIVDGKLSAETLKWVEEMLAEAAKENKAVIAMMHHGVVEHYKGQEKSFGEYLVDDYDLISRLLAMYNVRLAFTGHYHAQDITVARWPEAGKFLYDIETGSLVTYPNPYRIVTIASQEARVQSSSIAPIVAGQEDFKAYAREYARQGIAGIASQTLQGYRVGQQEAEALASQIADAFLAHYAGDEKLPPDREMIRTEGLSLLARLVVLYRKDLIEGLWQDLEPPDNELVINLSTGEWK